MNSPIDLRVSRSLELMTKLRETAAAFAGKEAQLSREFTLRRAAETRKFREEDGRAEAWAAEETAQAEAERTAQETAARALAGHRRQRIERTLRAGNTSLNEQARQAKERWLGQLQMKHFKATRDLPAQRAAIEAAFAEFLAALAAAQTTLARYERRIGNAFLGYGSFRKLLRPAENPPEGETAGDFRKLLVQIQKDLPLLENELAAFQRFGLARFFSYLPLPASIPLIFFPCVLLGYLLGSTAAAFGVAGVVAVLAIAGLVLAHRKGKNQAQAAAETLAASFARTRRLVRDCAAMARAEQEKELRQLEADYDTLCTEVNEQWTRGGEIEQTFSTNLRAKIERQAPRLLEKNERLLLPKLQRSEADYTARLARISGRTAEWKAEISQANEKALAALATEEQARWAELEASWHSEILPVQQAIEAINEVMARCTPSWATVLSENWKPAAEFPPGVQFATLDLDLAGQPVPQDPRLALPEPGQKAVPLALAFPACGSLLFETNGPAGPLVMGTLNAVILRLLASAPPGKLAFTIIDPVGLGQNFAGLMHLADYEESLINRRIWTQRDQIEERLGELNEHIEKVIQMYLRNEYATITEYNAQAGSVAEKYHFLVVADFPANFSETAAKRLQSIAASGPRCGVFTLVHWDRRQPLPDGFAPDELRESSVCIRRDHNEWIFTGQKNQTVENTLAFAEPPSPEQASELVHKIGRHSLDSNRVEVPFAQVAPKPEERWTNETTSELKIAIGRTGATKLQYLAIGKGTRQHALFAGKTGSGKSTLFHVIITNLALSCSPEQVEFYLIDFKKGVEFKCYATHRLPHARVVAIESDREFGLSVLRRVDDELKRRGDLFRKLGVQDLAGYKKAGGAGPMPRTLLIIDEFQEFFVDDDEIAQTASLLFDRIVRQGRAFGIHVLLGSQTLGGAYTLARATLGQMVIRVALQCNEADAYLIMDDNNAAPRLLSRPGEGIYNDAAGALEGNSPFQVVWLPDDERDAQLEKVRTLAEQHGTPQAGPIVFEGNAPADIRENPLLRSALEGRLPAAPAQARCWLGAPNSIKGPTEAIFQRQSGSHLLIVGQRDEAIASMLGASLLALAAQDPAGAAKFVLFHTGSPGAPDVLGGIAAALPRSVTIAQGNDVARTMNDLMEELKARSGEDADENAPPVFVFIHHLQKFKKLRHEDDFDFSSGADSAPSPGSQLNTLLSEGSSHGIHLIVTLDTFNNVGRFLSRKALTEFEMRVVFQMSANDSASLIDSPQAGGLGLHRALFYNEREGYLETFRPYAPPEADWLQQALRELATLQTASR